MPDVAAIARASGLTLRKVRYVLEHDILPGGNLSSRGRGATRSYDAFEAFGIVTAALMLEAGLKRALVRQCMSVLCSGDPDRVATMPLYRAYESRRAARLEVGDWEFVRLSGSSSPPVEEFNTGWRPLGDILPREGYSPLMNVVIDVRLIRSRLNFRE